MADYKLPWMNAVDWAGNASNPGGINDADRLGAYRKSLDYILTDPNVKAAYDKTKGAQQDQGGWGIGSQYLDTAQDVQNQLDFVNAAKNSTLPQNGLLNLGQYKGITTAQEEEALKQRLKELQNKELGESRRTDLKGQLDTQMANLQGRTNDYNSMLDERLGNMLKEYGLAAAVQRQGIGAQYADRGLNRSSFAQNAVEGSYQKELQNKMDARLATNQAQQANQSVVDKMNSTLQNQKELLDQQKNLGQEDVYQKYLMDLKEQTMRQMYESEDFAKKMDAASQAQASQQMGSLLGSAASIALLALL